MGIQFLALLTDSLRLLRSRRLFWLSLSLSALAAVALFGAYSFNDKGIRFFWFETWENPMLRAGTSGPRSFVTYLFNGPYVKIWLCWGATILALISTASILPDFLSSGSIEMSLSKPIRRFNLFAVKILGAALFVLLQVALGVGLSYLFIGLKFGLWLHESLLAVPLIALEFLYLYAFSAVLAVLTRSTIVCVLGTMLLWFLCFLVQFSSGQIDRGVGTMRYTLAQAEQRASDIRARADKDGRPLTGSEDAAIMRALASVDEDRKSLSTWEPWQQRIHLVELSLPKTGDIQKILANVANAPVQNEFFGMLFGAGERFRPRSLDEDEWREIQAQDAAGDKAQREVNAAESVTTSCIVTVALYAFAAWRFSRRDF